MPFEQLKRTLTAFKRSQVPQISQSWNLNFLSIASRQMPGCDLEPGRRSQFIARPHRLIRIV
jgi:hypothetical protein